MAIDVKAEAKRIAMNYSNAGHEERTAVAGGITSLVTRAVADAKRETTEHHKDVVSWAQCVLTALNVGDVAKESPLHKKLREVMISYRTAFATTEPRDVSKEDATSPWKRGGCGAGQIMNPVNHQQDAGKDDARELRECVNGFAAGMLAKLMTPKNRVKGDRQGWLSMSIQALEDRLEVETYELHEAIANGKSVEEIEDEARDVANFAMMIADKARELGLDGAA